METLTLGSGVNWIEQWAFSNCRSLVDVYCHAAAVPVAFDNSFEGSYVSYTVLHVPASAKADYSATSPWNQFGRIEAIGETAIRDVRLEKGVNDAPYYNLHGVRVIQPRKGIFIKNGKKILRR